MQYFCEWELFSYSKIKTEFWKEIWKWVSILPKKRELRVLERENIVKCVLKVKLLPPQNLHFEVLTPNTSEYDLL